MSEECAEPNCNQPAGHETPHGIAAAPGLVFAPFYGRTVGDSEPVDLPCNSCAAPMVMRRFDGGASFSCTACRQIVTAMADSMSETILPRLYPSGPMPPAQHHEYADYVGDQRRFIAKANLLCGLLTPQQYEQSLIDTGAAIEQYKAEHPIPLKATLRKLALPWSRWFKH